MFNLSGKARWAVLIFLSMIKVARHSRFGLPINRVRATEIEKCVVIGNGPSLAEALSEHPEFFEGKTNICVNEFAFSEAFEKVRPQ